MHFKGIDLNLLVVLDALLVERSTTKAGERLFLSQSATSGALSRLREYFGDPLLVRGRRNKMVLTPLAQNLAGPVRTLLSQAETVLTSNAAFDPATSSRHFRLNMGDEVATVLIPDVRKRVRKSAPNVGLEILSYNPTGDMARELADVLESGDLDFLIAPKIFTSPHHPKDLLFTEHYVCVAWEGNTLLRDTISAEEFYSLGHVATQMGARNRYLPEGTLLHQGLKEPRGIDIIVPTFTLKAFYVIGTDLIASLQESLARHFATYLPLKIFPMPVDNPSVGIFIEWHRYHDHDPATRWLLGILKDCAASIYRGRSQHSVRLAAPISSSSAR